MRVKSRTVPRSGDLRLSRFFFRRLSLDSSRVAWVVLSTGISPPQPRWRDGKWLREATLRKHLPTSTPFNPSMSCNDLFLTAISHMECVKERRYYEMKILALALKADDTLFRKTDGNELNQRGKRCLTSACVHVISEGNVASNLVIVVFKLMLWSVGYSGSLPLE